jgi:CRP-like cAMP-binding protein
METAHSLPPAGPLAGIFARLFGRRDVASGLPTRRERLRAIAGSAAADRAVELLTAQSALVQLESREARVVVSYMQPRRIAAGTKFIQEGDTENTDYMLLVLNGEVTIETVVVSRNAPITMSVLGAGSLIGEMGLIDGSPRSASCTALSDLACAILTRENMNRLLDESPRTAAKLVMAISMRIAQRMRDNQAKLKLYSQLTQAMNEEINELMPL